MMDTTAGETPQSSTSGSSGNSKPLSCTSCRQRKVKCNKVHPCGPCLKTGIQCVFPARVRVPRGRQGGSKTRDSELLQRIARLESLVSKVDAAKLALGSPNASDHSPSAVEDEVPAKASGHDAEPPYVDGSKGNMEKSYAAFIKRQTTGVRYMGREFWNSLEDEVDGLRQLLERPADDDDEDDAEESHQQDLWTTSENSTSHSSPQYLFQSPDSAGDSGFNRQPSDMHREILFRAFFTNVNPLVKIIHEPTLTDNLLHTTELLDVSAGRYKFSSLEAMSRSIYYAAVTSLTQEECLKYFEEDREPLLKRLQHDVEFALAKADLLNSMEIVTLVAFTLYLTALRANTNKRSSWSLVALAVRIAHSLGIHRDGEGTQMMAFEAEMRRRVWWQLISLDIRASEDRGSEPIITQCSYTTRMPHNINDEDMGYNSAHPLIDRKGFTDMTFTLMGMDMSNTTRRVNFIPPAVPAGFLTFGQKEIILREFAQRMENYTQGTDPNTPVGWMVQMMGRYFVLRLWSIVQYPLQSRKTTHNAPRGQALRTAVALLEISELLEANPFIPHFLWLWKTYVPWHTIAVTLAELCSQTEGPVVEKAWALVERGIPRWSSRVADTEYGMLWKPIRKLHKKAMAIRARGPTILKQPEQATTVPPNQQATVQQLPLPTMESGNIIPNMPDLNITDAELKPCPYQSAPSAPPLATPYFIPSLGDNFDWMAPLDVSTDLGREAYHGPINWDDWNEFIYDAGEVTVDFGIHPIEAWSPQM